MKSRSRDKASTLSQNLWWSWQQDGEEMWRTLGGERWRESRHNPKRLLQLLEKTPFRPQPVKDQLDQLHAQQREYLDTKDTWHARIGAPCEGGVAYFSAEYGLHESIAIYSGGLGVLAGDHVKSASDLGLPLTAVGLLYRNGYVQQQIDRTGEQQALFLTYRFEDYPIQALRVNDQLLKVEVPIFGQRCLCQVWSLSVGRVELLLLDTDLEENPQALRKITAQLYGGDDLTRIQQELILGIGGVRALRALDRSAQVFHLNEGHSSFLNLERLRELMTSGVSYEDALAQIKAHSVFTTHTPVEAGHDRFDVELVWRALSWFAHEVGLSRKQVLALGHWPDEEDSKALFNMTLLALHTSDHVNGVAALHGEVSREMFCRFWGVSPNETPIGHVTNGVHAPTWQADELRSLLSDHLKGEGAERGPEDSAWSTVSSISDQSLWEIKGVLRQRLIDLGRRREAERRRRLGLPVWRDRLDPNALTIGFARRFATYKRANLIFSSVQRLVEILTSAPGPVQLFFAGKAHPADEAGRALVRAIYEASLHPKLRGRVLLIEDYDIEVGRVMVQGSDVWLNNPRRPKEASGTSGMKVSMNGGLNLSILDGWWPEGFNGSNGWAIGKTKHYAEVEEQDREDAESLYQCLADEVIPTFFKRDTQNLPTEWLNLSKSAIASCTPLFHSHRQVRDYVHKLYIPAKGE